MDWHYSEEWADLRRLRKRIVTVVTGCVVIFASVPVVRSIPGQLGVAFGVGLFTAWVVLVIKLFLLQAEYTYWSCPRCGKPFHCAARGVGRWINPFARQCLHCGLPKWLAVEPNTLLKRDLTNDSEPRLR